MFVNGLRRPTIGTDGRFSCAQSWCNRTTYSRRSRPPAARSYSDDINLAADQLPRCLDRILWIPWVTRFPSSWRHRMRHSLSPQSAPSADRRTVFALLRVFGRILQ